MDPSILSILCIPTSHRYADAWWTRVFIWTPAMWQRLCEAPSLRVTTGVGSSFFLSFTKAEFYIYTVITAAASKAENMSHSRLPNYLYTFLFMPPSANDNGPEVPKSNQNTAVIILRQTGKWKQRPDWSLWVIPPPFLCTSVCFLL